MLMAERIGHKLWRPGGSPGDFEALIEGTATENRIR